jgi:FtsH-binding integral membrane protein
MLTSAASTSAATVTAASLVVAATASSFSVHLPRLSALSLLKPRYNNIIQTRSFQAKSLRLRSSRPLRSLSNCKFNNIIITAAAAAATHCQVATTSSNDPTNTTSWSTIPGPFSAQCHSPHTSIRSSHSSTLSCTNQLIRNHSMTLSQQCHSMPRRFVHDQRNSIRPAATHSVTQTESAAAGPSPATRNVTNSTIDVHRSNITFTHTKSSSSEAVTSSSAPEPVIGDKVANDWALSRFVLSTYATVGVAATGTLGIMYGATLSPEISALALAYCPHLMLAGVVTTLGSVLGMHFTKKHSTIIRDRDGKAIAMQDSKLRNAFFATLVASSAATLTPVAILTSAISPMILPASAVISGSVMAGASLYAYRTPSSKLSKWRGPLTGGLFGLLGVGIASMAAHYFIGPNSVVSHMLHEVNVYAGIGLFTAYTAYDTHVMVKQFETGDPDVLGAASKLHLNFVSLLVRIMHALSSFARRRVH